MSCSTKERRDLQLTSGEGFGFLNSIDDHPLQLCSLRAHINQLQHWTASRERSVGKC